MSHSVFFWISLLSVAAVYLGPALCPRIELRVARTAPTYIPLVAFRIRPIRTNVNNRRPGCIEAGPHRLRGLSA